MSDIPGYRYPTEDDISSHIRSLIEDEIRRKKIEYHEKLSAYDRYEIEKLRLEVASLKAQLKMILEDHSQLMIKYVELKQHGNKNEPNR